MLKNLLTLSFISILSLTLHAQVPTFIFPELTVDNEEEFDIEVKVENFSNLVSAQYTMEWDPTKLEFIEVYDLNLIDLEPASFGDTSLNTSVGLLPFIWLDKDLSGTTIDDETIIYKVKMRAISGAADTAALSFVGTPASIEVVDITFTPVDSLNLVEGQVNILEPLSTNNLDNSSIQKLEIYPNPFSDFVHIDYELKEITDVTLVITDLLGREVLRQSEKRATGFHQVKIDGSVFPSNGEYIYQVQTEEYQLIGKLVFAK